LAVLGHGQDARGTRRRRKRKVLVKKAIIYRIALQRGGAAKESQKSKGKTVCAGGHKRKPKGKCQKAKVKVKVKVKGRTSGACCKRGNRMGGLI
jgi:hypothetical protein